LRNDREWLLDILDALKKIEKYSSRGYDAFAEEELLQIWVIHYLEVVGEASNHISKALLEKHTDIPWADIVGLRNILVHQYFGIDLKRVWETVEVDLPVLKKRIEEILAELEHIS
jgi:uncharacterized protein with HEPN domain